MNKETRFNGEIFSTVSEYAVKLATNLPKPKSLTQEDMHEIEKEGKRLVKEIEKSTKNLENLTGEDLRIIIK